MRLNLKHGDRVDLGRIDTEETVIIEGVDNLRIKNVEVVARTTGAAARRDLEFQPTSLNNRWPRCRAHLLFQDCKNLTIDRAVVQGPHVNGGVGNDAYSPALEGQHAFSFLGCQGVNVRNLKAREVHGDFLYFGSMTRGVRLDGADFAKNGRMGISFVAGEDFFLRNIWMDQMRRAAFDLEPNTAKSYVRKVRVENVILGERRLMFVAGWGKGDVSDVSFSNVHSTSGLTVSVSTTSGGRRRNWSFDNCTGQKRVGGVDAPWNFREIDGVRVTNVRQPLKPGRGLVLVNTPGCTNVVQSGNRTELIPGA